MPSPILILAAEAGEIAPWLAARLPGEEIAALTDARGLDAVLAEDPEVAFLIRTEDIPVDAYRRVLAHRSIRWVHVGGSGYEYLGAWDPSRVAVTNCVGVLARYLAETTIGAILALNGGLIRYRDAQRAREWQPGLFRPVAGQRLLVVGAGAIGREVAVRARALGMEVTGLNRSGVAVHGVAEVRPLLDLDALLPEADIVSCHLRLTPGTARLFDARRFALMKPGALFLNSARGGCVDELALDAALASGRLGGAWCDVFETEPLPERSPLWDRERLLITPHCADQIEGWPLRFADLFVENLGRFRRGEPLINAVTP